MGQHGGDGPAGTDLGPAHAAFAEFQEDYVRHYVSLADTKATIILGLVTTFLTYLTGREKFGDLVLHPGHNWQWPIADVAVALLVGSAVAAFSVIVPRTARGGERIVYFDTVAKYPSRRDYMDDVCRRSDGELASVRLSHCYDVSRICARKYWWLRWAVWLGVIGIALGLPVLATI